MAIKQYKLFSACVRESDKVDTAVFLFKPNCHCDISFHRLASNPCGTMSLSLHSGCPRYTSDRCPFVALLSATTSWPCDYFSPLEENKSAGPLCERDNADNTGSHCTVHSTPGLRAQTAVLYTSQSMQYLPHTITKVR